MSICCRRRAACRCRQKAGRHPPCRDRGASNGVLPCLSDCIWYKEGIHRLCWRFPARPPPLVAGVFGVSVVRSMLVALLIPLFCLALPGRSRGKARMSIARAGTVPFSSLPRQGKGRRCPAWSAWAGLSSMASSWSRGAGLWLCAVSAGGHCPVYALAFRVGPILFEELEAKLASWEIRHLLRHLLDAAACPEHDLFQPVCGGGNHDPACPLRQQFSLHGLPRS